MCTYNGGSFLREQLESLEEQTLPPRELVVCDDGSTDYTLELLKQFSSRVHFPVRIYCNEQQLGVIQNYSRALGLCRGDYVALCDQDDIWHPEKLALAMQCIREAEKLYGNGIPMLLHTDLQVTDLNGNVIAPSLMKLQKINHVEEEPLKTLLVQNFVTGCTALANRPLIEAALPLPVQALMHDWWVALTAATLGKLIFLPRPTVFYRQHGCNTIGAKKYYSGKNLMRLARIDQLEQLIARTIEQGQALQKRLEYLNIKMPDYLPDYLEVATQNGKKAASWACSHGIAKQGRMRNLFFLLLLMKSNYLKHLGEHRAINGNHS